MAESKGKGDNGGEGGEEQDNKAEAVAQAFEHTAEYLQKRWRFLVVEC